MKKRVIKLVLLGADFSSSNFGCSALAYSFLGVLEDLSRELNVFFEITSVNYNDFKSEKENIYIVENMPVHYKSIGFYLKYIKKIKESDYVFDFTGGDSFTDLYGKGRFIKESILKELAIFYKAKLILGPQTIGPFKSKFIKNWAKHILSKSSKVYVRDELSEEFVKNLNCKCFRFTDIAFMLKPSKDEFEFKENGHKKVGLNISALMLNNGYSNKNSLGLRMDYEKFCAGMINMLLQNNYDVYLLAHVLSNNNVENDYSLCEKLYKENPGTYLSPKFKSPMEAKKYMSKLDCVIGSRMHATIGAFSVGTPIIAVSYSRKFEGLYYSIGYRYVINAKKSDEYQAIEQVMNWLADYHQLCSQHEKAMGRVEKYNDLLKDSLKHLFS